MDYNTVLKFWFEELTPADWFRKNPTLDQKIHHLFYKTHQRVEAGETETWRRSPEGALAEIIVLDQFSRNMFRDTPQSFHYDSMALTLSQRAIELSMDHELPFDQRKFIYMPFMHSESAVIHQHAERLFKDLGDEDTLRFERLHKDIIDRFGRYPHRNKVLGRSSTPEEIEFLKQENSSF